MSLNRLDAQAATYTDASPEKILEQLGICYTKLRTFERAVASRDRTIHDLQEKLDERERSLALREKVIAMLRRRLAARWDRVVYAVVGAVVAKLVEVGVVHWFFR